MKTKSEPETGNQFTGANRGNREGVHWPGRPTNHHAGGRSLPRNSLCDFRSLLFDSRSAIRPALAALLTALVALLPGAAQAQAIEAWVQRYNGPGNGYDNPSAVAVDHDNNVIVTGLSQGSGSDDDYATIKYSNAGVPLWTNRYNGPFNSADRATALAVDSSNNVIVTGFSLGDGYQADFLTIKYSSAGVPLWTSRYTEPGNSEDRVSAVAVDGNNNVIVTGCSDSDPYYPSVNYDYLTIKYSSAGVPVWTNRYNGPGNDWDQPGGIAVDSNNDVVVTGYTMGSGSSQDATTIKYSSAGVPLWTNCYNGPGNGIDGGNAVAVGSNNSIIVTGYSVVNGSLNDYHYLTIEYLSAGVPLWTNLYRGPGNGYNSANAVAVDSSNNIIVTGNSYGSGGDFDYATIKYSSAGVPLWTNRYNGPGNYRDIAWAVVVDGENNVIVAGYSAGTSVSPYNWDYATLAYTSAGVPLWTNRYNGPANGEDEARSAPAVDSIGNVYVSGYSAGVGSGADYATVKYSVVPVITRQPLSRTNSVGTTASFSVEAAGSVPLSYQWRRQGANLLNGPNVSGVATTNLVLTNVQLADAAGYTVVVTNAYGSVTSSVAQLTVVNPGRFTNLSYSPAMGFSFVFRDGILGRPYRIQRSPSLAEGSWVDWQSFTYTEPILLTDMGATGMERRFYRAVSP